MVSEFTTPESHQSSDLEITEMTKESVRDADPNGGRCLVTNTTLAVQYYHYIPKSMIGEKVVCF